MKIFVTRLIPGMIQKIMTDAGHEIEIWQEERALESGELIAKCQQAEALLCISQPLNADFFLQCPNLRVVATNSVGYDQIDVAKATELGIPIGNTPGVLSKATGDTAFLLMQMVARKALFWHKQILDDNWGFAQPFENLGIDLQGKTLGIFGLGRIGIELAKSAQGAFDMPLIYHNRNKNEEAEKTLGARYVGFEELLEQSDVLSVHANLNNENKGIFDLNVFSKMKREAIFINTARGALHQEDDLLKALQDGIIAGAGLDVTNPEPMKADHPLLSLKNTAILPHIGSATAETRKAMLSLSAYNILAGLEGKPLPECVNPEVYQKNQQHAV